MPKTSSSLKTALQSKAFGSFPISEQIHNSYKCSKGHEMKFYTTSPYKGLGARCSGCNLPINVSEGLYHCKTDWEDYHIHCVKLMDHSSKLPKKISKSGNPFHYGYPKSPKGTYGFGSKIPFPPPTY